MAAGSRYCISLSLSLSVATDVSKYGTRYTDKLLLLFVSVRVRVRACVCMCMCVMRVFKLYIMRRWRRFMMLPNIAYY